MVRAVQESGWALSTLLTHHGFCHLGSVFIPWYAQDSPFLVLPQRSSGGTSMLVGEKMGFSRK